MLDTLFHFVAFPYIQYYTAIVMEYPPRKGQTLNGFALDSKFKRESVKNN